MAVPWRNIDGIDFQLQLFLTLALDGGEWSTSRPGRFTFEKRDPAPTEEEAWWAPDSVWAF
jgi:hypothetical protein